MKKTTLIFSSLLLLSVPFLNQVNAYPIAQASPVASDPTPVSTSSPIAAPNPSPPPVNDFAVTKANLTSALTQSRSLVGYLNQDQNTKGLTLLALKTEHGFAESIGYDLNTASSNLSGGASAVLLSQINAAIISDKDIIYSLNFDQAYYGQSYHHDIVREINTANLLMNQILSALNDLTILSIIPSPTPTPVSTPLISPTPTKPPITASPVTARTPNPNPGSLSPTSGNLGQTDQQKLDYLRTNGSAGLLAIQKTIDVRQNTIAYLNSLNYLSNDQRNALTVQLHGEIQILNGFISQIRADKTMADLQKDEEAYFYKWANLSDTSTSIDQSYQFVNIYAANSEEAAMANFEPIFNGLQTMLTDLSKSYSKNDLAHFKMISDLQSKLQSTRSLILQQKLVANAVIDKLALLYVKKNTNFLFFNNYTYVPGGKFSGDVTTIINNEGNILKGIDSQLLTAKSSVHTIVAQVEQQISLLFDGKTVYSEVINPLATWYVSPDNGFAVSFIKPSGYVYQVSNNVPASKSKIVNSCIVISASPMQNFQCDSDNPPIISDTTKYIIEIDKVSSLDFMGSTKGSQTVVVGYDTGQQFSENRILDNNGNYDRVLPVTYTSSINKEMFVIKLLADHHVLNNTWVNDEDSLIHFLNNFIVVK
jgi:hypothetical protein